MLEENKLNLGKQVPYCSEQPGTPQVIMPLEQNTDAPYRRK